MRIVVTGGRGFLGRHLVERLRRAPGAPEVVASSSAEADLNHLENADRLLDGADGVFHLAARVGGIEHNRRNPARLLYDNAIAGLNVLEAARRRDVGWVVTVGSACAYPGEASVPTSEDQLWDGYPEATNAPYGIAKRVLAEATAAYARQYGLRAMHVVPTNLYGPYDRFDAASSHVIPALLLRFHEAKERGLDEVVCWGDGTPTRDFLYVEDCAEILSRAPATLREPHPVNLGRGHEVSIRETVSTIRDVVGYRGRVAWDTSKPNGQRRRALSTKRMESLFGPFEFTPFERGLRLTYDYFLTSGGGAEAR